MYKRIIFALFFLFTISVSCSAVRVFAATGDETNTGGNGDKPDGTTTTTSNDGTTDQDDDNHDEGGTAKPNDEGGTAKPNGEQA